GRRAPVAINVPPPTAGITSRDEGSDLDDIRTAILALQIYAEGLHDDQELAVVHQCILNLQKILANHDKNRDAAMGVTPALKHVRRVALRRTRWSPACPDPQRSGRPLRPPAARRRHPARLSDRSLERG